MDGRFIGEAADFFLLAAAFVGEAGSIEWAVDLSESDETGSAAQTSKTVALGRQERAPFTQTDRQTRYSPATPRTECVSLRLHVRGTGPWESLYYTLGSTTP